MPSLLSSMHEVSLMNDSHVRSSWNRADEGMPNFVKVDVMDLLRNLRHTLQRIPGTDAFWRARDVGSLVSITVTRLRLKFMLERAVINNEETSDFFSLIAVSRSLLTLSLRILECKDYFSEQQIELIDIAYFEALPPAGVLAIEVLRRDRLKYDESDFPRSEILQNLSILVPELEAVGPEEGKYGVCIQGANAIKKVLETCLARRPQPLDATQAAMLDGQLGFNNDADFLDWLGHVDLETVSWLDGA
ncbi:hypothetical protein AC579_7005 [Pseudocercospora musae]|uniref:Uncharacterized protein n=1 Tax=Pseudocercospora musae TaxID=113226 RepID=A0A139GTB7_9PEZI|nr:hypothetical protein AC579_7005 [Pseudocercospora musae]